MNVTFISRLAGEATNNEPGSPDAKTMSTIAEASFDVEDFWRVADVLHNRLESINWEHWRELYKSLVLLEFLLTHGPVEFAEEFQRDFDIIQDLGAFKHIDGKGFNWGANMEKRAENILELLRGGEPLKEARLKALKITREIQGFGNFTPSPNSSSSSSSSTSSEASRASSFGSYSSTSSIYELAANDSNYSQGGLEEFEDKHKWNCHPIQESGRLLDPDEDDENNAQGIIGKICSKLVGISPSKDCGGIGDKVILRSFSDVGRPKKIYDRQFSLRC
ncbi:putative ENTH/VHS family protein [Tripterygium wilfordii]|uniref:Putative ENTH/VHS family protein n=1 Tax=Tripterygium wilfordii TaxID=458696 RepID=A0A7J7CRK2_TRIWF|nr:putative ENTH/VHS family protein [Tripterygium wilfordii]